MILIMTIIMTSAVYASLPIIDLKPTNSDNLYNYYNSSLFPWGVIDGNISAGGEPLYLGNATMIANKYNETNFPWGTISGNASPSTGSSQWTASNNMLYNTTANVGILTNNTYASLHIANGMVNATNNNSIVEIEGYINNPYFSIGYSHNMLLQSESFDTTWERFNITTITANSRISPIGTLIAENISGNTSNIHARVRQAIINNTVGNYTFSLWISTSNNIAPEAQIYLRILSDGQNTTSNQTINITRQWKRYAITQELNNTHVQKIVEIYPRGNNISVWGAQLEYGQLPGTYAAPRTTSATIAQAALFYSRFPITSAGALTGVGVAVGGALSGATTGAFSGIVTHTSAPAFVSTDGLVLTSTTAATIAAPIQVSPRLRLSGTVWNNLTGLTLAHNWMIEASPIVDNNNFPKTYLKISTSFLGVGDNETFDMMRISSNGTTSLIGNSFGAMVLANWNFTGNTSWVIRGAQSQLGGWYINTTSNMTRFVYNATTNKGNLTQNATHFAVPAKPNRWYKLDYNISGTGVAGCIAFVNKDFAEQETHLIGVSLTTANQLRRIYFKSNSNPQNFTISAQCTAGSFYLDQLNLTEVTSGNLEAMGTITGGGSQGINIDGYGNVTIQNLSGTGNAFACINAAGQLYRSATACA